MNFHVLTLFPEMINQGAGTSILGRAITQGLIHVEAVNIRDFTKNKHSKVDDYPYGGGAGMVMQAQPVYDACCFVKEKTGDSRTKVIYLTPQGNTFNQQMARSLADEENLIFLCGHYEGIDERVLEEVVTDYVSIGDFVLTGGELPAMVMIDAISRLIPGVLNNEVSAETESFDNDLLEYPHYSRPEEWRNKKVPEILLCGDHRKVEEWRLDQAVKRTINRRPDLYDKYKKRQVLAESLRKKDKVLYTDITEILKRGDCEILMNDESGCVIWDERGGIFLLALLDETKADKVVNAIPARPGEHKYVLHHQKLCEEIKHRFVVEKLTPCRQAVYTRRETIKMSGDLSFAPLNMDDLEVVLENYHMVPDKEYIQDRIKNGDLFGAYLREELVGFVGRHEEGSMGMLEVFEKHRKKGYGLAMESYMVNKQLADGNIPYCHIVSGNDASLALQEKLGFRVSKESIFWITAQEMC